jgi:hypothetical protein
VALLSGDVSVALLSVGGLVVGAAGGDSTAPAVGSGGASVRGGSVGALVGTSGGLVGSTGGLVGSTGGLVGFAVGGLDVFAGRGVELGFVVG